MTDISTNFYLITFVHKAAGATKVDLHAIFDAVLASTALDVDESHIKCILEKDLSINVSKFDKRLVKVLTESLIYYMSIWPGWQRSKEYVAGDLEYQKWLSKFRMYLMFKCNFVIKSAPKYIPTTPKTAECGTMTEKEVANNVAPYTLVVGGSPAMLNNFVFVEHNGDVLIKQHKRRSWIKLIPLEFLNWPYVSVEVNLPEMSFTRSVTHAYDRFIGLKGDTVVFSEISHIVHINKLQPNKQIQPYSLNIFESYVDQLTTVLTQIPLISEQRLVEINLILSQFLEDLKEINVCNNTMATNTCVGFHIGSCRYLRNKKMVSVSNDECTARQPINFYEVINPQITLALSEFDAKQDLSVQHTVAFEWLSKLSIKCSEDNTHEDVSKMRLLVNENCISYACTLCNRRFEGTHAYEKMTNHFISNHRSEQPVICYKCGKQFEFKHLASSRWKHPCLL